MFANSLGYAAAACLVMALGGCAIFTGHVSEPPEKSQPSASPPASERPREEQEGTTPELTAEEDDGGEAVLALMRQAKEHVSAEEYQQAAAALERALRIEPKNAVIYSQLAGLMMVQGMPDEAENLARKSNSLAGKRLSLQARNWRTIAMALRARGEKEAAKAADRRARELENRSGSAQ